MKDKKLLEQFLNSKLATSSRQIQMLPSPEKALRSRNQVSALGGGKTTFSGSQTLGQGRLGGISPRAGGSNSLYKISGPEYCMGHQHRDGQQPQPAANGQLCSPIEGQLIEAELRQMQRLKRRNNQNGGYNSYKSGIKMNGNEIETRKWQFFGLNKASTELNEKAAQRLTSAMRIESQSLPKTYDQDVIQTQ